MALVPNTTELLAPAGKWDTMVEVLAAGADAVYLGGKRFNMRLLRSDHNFSDQELREAVNYCHERDKKLYVTVNNLIYQDELTELTEYLAWLQEIKADAVIVQDLAVASLAQQAAPGLPLHASVQMGVANSAAAQFLAEQGFARAILSKNVTREEIASIHRASTLELEYFIHGDVCISHTGQCYLSAFIFGESGNRGRCKKPCRWSYRLSGDQEHSDGYYLAHQDLCLLDELPDLLESGVVSLKIEGRMRDAKYLSSIVSAYRQAIEGNRAGNKLPASIKEDLVSQRVRDFTTAGFSRRPTPHDIGISGEREPRFPTGPISISVPDRAINPAEPAMKAITAHKPELQVIVDGEPAAATALSAGIQSIILNGSGIYPLSKVDLTSMSSMAAVSRAQVVYQLPRVITEGQLGILRRQLAQLQSLGITTVVVSDLGSMKLAKQMGLAVWGDFSLNIANEAAASFLGNRGIERVTASLELRQSELRSWLEAAQTPIDVLAHGWLPGMVTDLCLRGLANENCPRQGEGSELYLVDQEDNRYPVVCDQFCRHHIYYPFKLSLLGHVSWLIQRGVSGLRLDLTGYTESQAAQVIAVYQQAMEDHYPGGLTALKSATGEEYTDTPFVS